MFQAVRVDPDLTRRHRLDRVVRGATVQDLVVQDGQVVAVRLAKGGCETDLPLPRTPADPARLQTLRQQIQGRAVQDLHYVSTPGTLHLDGGVSFELTHG